MRNNTVEKAVFLSVRDEKTYKKTCHICQRFRLFCDRYRILCGQQGRVAFLVSVEHLSGRQNVICPVREHGVKEVCVARSCEYAILVRSYLSFCQTVEKRELEKLHLFARHFAQQQVGQTACAEAQPLVGEPFFA